MNPRSASDLRLEADRSGLVSATVYLPRDKLDLIKRICAGKNIRISDFISEAVDEYLRKHND
jgi:hypothetical protein